MLPNFRRSRTLPALEILEDRTVPAATLVRDINQTTAGSLTQSTSEQFIKVGTSSYFTADDGVHGLELWKSDGTASGTKLVKDITPGADPSGLGSLTAVGNKVLFTVSNSLGRSLWASDGTEAGTRSVWTLGPSEDRNAWLGLTAAGNYLFFTVRHTAGGVALWKTDGTAAGTILLHDFAASITSSDIRLTASGNAVYFFAIDGTPRRQLWKSDGTVSGTVPLANVAPSHNPSDVGSLQVQAGRLYFSADDGVHGLEPWTSDGTAAGTRMIADVNPGSGHSSPSSFTAAGGRLYFSADNGRQGAELWTSDGTEAGTRMVKDINPPLPEVIADGNDVSDGSIPWDFTVVGDTVFFVADDGTHGRELWKTDGTEQGTVLVRDIWTFGEPDPPVGVYSPGWRDVMPTALTTFGGKLYFVAYNSGLGMELWRSDGTEAGTVRVIGREPDHGPEWFDPPRVSGLAVVGDRLLFTLGGANDDALMMLDRAGSPVELTRLPRVSLESRVALAGGRLLFGGYDGTHGYEPWVTDFTPAGTRLLADVNTMTLDSTPRNVTSSGGVTYFVANDGVREQLWRTDGTPGGTRKLPVELPDPSTHYYGGSSPQITDLRDVNGTLYFHTVVYRAPDSTEYQLWKTDGTDAGTVRILYDGAPNAVVFKGRLFFGGSLSYYGPSGLWMSDGTPDAAWRRIGTFNVVNNLTVVVDTLYFTANDPVHGQELWKTDGTDAGTVMVKEINPGQLGSSPTRLTAVGNRLYFTANDGTHGAELWTSDGTAGGTRLVKDVLPGTADSTPAQLTAVGGRLFFAAADAEHGWELWRSDGTAAGTVLVKDINPGRADAGPRDLTAVGGQLYFTASDLVHGMELWKTDGTAAGTVMVKDTLPGSTSSFPRSLAVVGDRLYFLAKNAEQGVGVWESDGTAGGTRLVQAVNSNSAPPGLWGANGVLYFTTSDPQHGQELWRLPPPAPPAPPASNRPPTASAGGPYSVSEGQSLMLDASRSTDPDRDTLTYSWDVNGDGVYGDATGVKPTLSAARLRELGLRGGPTASRVRVRVDDGRGRTATADATLTLRDGPLTVRSVEVKAVEAKEFRGVVATFTDPGGPERVANYAATIDWGDGRIEVGTVKLVGDRFEVSGRHTYARRGDYRVRVTVRDQGGAPATSTGTARIADAPLVASGIPFRATEGVAFSGVVGRFRDDNPNGVLADYRVTIDWGDGKKSAATLVPKGRGLFEIRGTHTYARAGTYTVILQVLSNGGSTAKATFRITVGKRRPGV